MEWTINIDEEKRYAEIVTSGVADMTGSLNMAKAIATSLGIHAISKILIVHTDYSICHIHGMFV